MVIWKYNNKKCRPLDVISKNNGKCRTSAKQSKLYIIRKILIRAIQRCTFYWIWATVSKVMSIDKSHAKIYFLLNLSHCVKCYRHFGQFWLFLPCPLTKYGHVMWPKMQISNFFIFFSNSTFNIRISYKFFLWKAIYSLFSLVTYIHHRDFVKYIGGKMSVWKKELITQKLLLRGGITFLCTRVFAGAKS